MLQAKRTPIDYMLRVAADEMECGEQVALPHIAAFLAQPPIRFLLRHVQNFTWTCERFWRRLSPALPEGAVRKRFARPQRMAAVVGMQRAKVWIDVTNTYRSGFGAGIGRVALQLADAAARSGLALPVVIENGRVYEYFQNSGPVTVLNFEADITYVIVDSFWEQIEEYRVVCADARARGAKIVACIHDVIALNYPIFFRREHFTRFAYGLEKLLAVSDGFIAVSEDARRQVERAIGEFCLGEGRTLPSTSFHLGADGHLDEDDTGVRREVRAAFRCSTTFLSVGTLEPRKGYAVTLDAFDALWRRDIDCRMVLIGRLGWLSNALRRRIVEHPRYGEALFWFTDASDAELTFAYRSAHSVIQASITEGFGLPVVEALYEGTPVIASDIEIFRELGEDEIVYFRPCDALDLAAKIETVIARRPKVLGQKLLRWDQSLEQMVSRISTMIPAPVA